MAIVSSRDVAIEHGGADEAEGQTVSKGSREGGREASTSLMTTLYLCLLMNEARRARHGVPDFHGYSLIIPADASRPRRESESVGSIQYMSDHF